jgi:hypothetical protein
MAEVVFDEAQLKKLAQFDKVAPEVVAPLMFRFMQGALETDLKGPLSKILPRGVTRLLSGALATEVKGEGLDINGRLFPTVGYAVPVALGRRPGGISRAGLSDLLLWARRKLGIASMDDPDFQGLKWTIIQKGTLRHRTGKDSRGMPNEWDTIRKQAVPLIKNRLEATVNRIAEAIANEID